MKEWAFRVAYLLFEVAKLSKMGLLEDHTLVLKVDGDTET